MSVRATGCTLAWFVALIAWVVQADVAAQPPQPPAAPATQADLQKAVEAIGELSKRVEALTGVVQGQADLVNNLQRDVTVLKQAGPVPAAAVLAAPAPAMLAVTEPPPVPGLTPMEAPAVAPNFWTVEAAQKLGLYRFEPRIVEATGILADIFGLAANAAAAAKTPEELQVVVNTFRDQFLQRLTASGRTEFTVQTWGNAANAWLAQVAERLKIATDFPAYQLILVDALRDGQKNAPAWGALIDKAHDDARGGAMAGTASGGGGAGVAGGTYGVGYMPPAAAFHYYWHVRKMNRIQSRINLYNSR